MAISTQSVPEVSVEPSRGYVQSGQARASGAQGLSSHESIREEATPAAIPGHIATLDGWRAVAILLVMYHHVVLPFSKEFIWVRAAEFGAFGVDIFFALSGFLICTKLLEELEFKGRIDLRQFYIRRTFRILPVYYAFLAFAFVLSRVGLESISRADFLSCVFFYRNYLPGDLWSWTTGHFWSLSVEEHFYLLFPLFLVVFGVRRAQFALPVVLLGLTIWRMADFRYQIFDRVIPGTVFPFRSDVRMDGIGFGCLAALLLTIPSVRKGAMRLAGFPAFLAVGALLIVTISVAVPLAILWQRLLVAVLILTTAFAPESLSGRFLELAPLRWIGSISYGLYIWQQIFLTEHPRFFLQTFPFNVACTFGLAYLSFIVLERPMIRLGRRFAAEGFGALRRTTVEAGQGGGRIEKQI